MSEGTTARRAAGNRTMRLSAFALGGGGYVLFVVFANMRMLGLAFLLAILCVAAACALFAVSVGEPPRSLRYVLLSSTMGFLRVLPRFRLSSFSGSPEECAPLQIPWACRRQSPGVKSRIGVAG
jgi:hypothetical protein